MFQSQVHYLFLLIPCLRKLQKIISGGHSLNITLDSFSPSTSNRPPSTIGFHHLDTPCISVPSITSMARATTLIQDLVISHFHYCHCLLAGSLSLVFPSPTIRQMTVKAIFTQWKCELHTLIKKTFSGSPMCAGKEQTS